MSEAETLQPPSTGAPELGIGRRILVSRFLTRSGDQAWDFAVPIVLLQLFPGMLQIASAYFFFVRLGHVLTLPQFAAVIDRVNRRQAAKIGIVLQLLSVLVGALLIGGGLFDTKVGESLQWWLTFGGLILAGLGSSLGGSFMDISVANDLVPAAIAPDVLPKFNSRLRQVDLFTEVASPVAAGALLLVALNGKPLMGFYLIAFWNIISFIPEYLLLRSIFQSRPDLLLEKAEAAPSMKLSLIAKLTGGWRAFLKEPVAPAVICYALVWLSVLSPHGVLLTGFLKGGWQIPEIVIGGFRGAGALFGLLATVAFPVVVKRFGLLRGSQAFVVYQAGMLVGALACFLMGGVVGQGGFLVLILFSRIGLYGFSLGEMQIRQVGIDPHVRGEVNGFSSAVTGIATLVLYGSGALLPSTGDFPILIVGSVVFVSLSALLYSVWVSRALARRTW